MRRIHGRPAGQCLLASILAAGAFGLVLWLLPGGVAGPPEPRPLAPGASPPPAPPPPPWTPDRPPSGPARELFESFAARPLPSWAVHGKGLAPKILMARFAQGARIEESSAYLLQARPWSAPGSSWWGHRGDYDFTLTVLTTLLYRSTAHPERISAPLEAHLLDRLLVLDGGQPALLVPRSLGLWRETENHILMTESSRYLKNQWLARRGSRDPAHDNRTNGLERWLLGHLQRLGQAGFHEFNSLPYLAYTVQPLLNLVSFAESGAVRARAQYLLDQINLHYALGSLGQRRLPPFRRQPRNAGQTSLIGDPHTAFMHVWLRGPDGTPPPALPRPPRERQMLMAAATGYTLPPDLRRWTLDKPHEYFARIGRGPHASPEIYSGGPGWLLSAGGAGRGLSAQVVARPTLLLLEDTALDLEETLHLPGAKGPFHSNNTGVYKRFACGPGPVRIPAGLRNLGAPGPWLVFGLGARPGLVAVHSSRQAGIIALFPDWKGSPRELCAALSQANPDPERLTRRFRWPGGEELRYDLEAPAGTWVMQNTGGSPLDRNYDAWSRLAGDLPEITFER